MTKHGVQLISPDMKFNRDLETYMEEEGLSDKGQTFHVVSIIGGQSTGKSTLLNAMFGTGFDMMDPSVGRQQTTKGIWCCKADGGRNILVMDVEGTDGREKEDQKAFEGKSALFSLALTDVMMINMWMHEVGRFNAANLPLLKTIFEVHLKLLIQLEEEKTINTRSRPLLLFVLRDCDGRTPVENLKKTILADLNKIWEDMNKPEKYAAASLDEFFEVQCEGLPHFVYQPDDWKKRVKEVAGQFTEEGIFKNRCSKDVPAEGFSSRKMLSIVRCDNKRKLYMDKAQKEYPTWVDDADHASFRSSIESQLTDLSEKFMGETVGYDPDVRSESARKLKAEILPLVNDKYEELVHAARERAETGIHEVIASLKPEEGELPKPGFSAQLREAAEKKLQEFKAALEELTPKDAVAWREKLFEKDGTVDQMQQLLEREQVLAKKEMEAEVRKTYERKLGRELSRRLVPLLDEAPLTMWAEVRKVHGQTVSLATEGIRDVLQDLGMWSDSDEPAVRASLRACADATVNDKVTDKASERSLSAKVFQHFDMLFNRQHGRVWRLWDNPDSEYVRARAAGLAVLDMFAVSRLYEDGAWPPGQSAVRYIDEPRRDVLAAEFEARAREELLWAQMARSNSSTHTSMLVTALILVLGWNEIFWLLTHPLYFILMVLAAGGGGAYYFLHFVGDWQQLVAFILKIVMQLMAPAAAAPPAGYGAPPPPPAATPKDGNKDPLAHAAHLAGPPGREKRPQSAPVPTPSLGTVGRSNTA